MNMTMQAPVQTDQPRYEITPDDKKRVAAIQAAWDAYHGNLKKPLIPMPGEADDNVMVNVCLPIVEAGTDFLFGQELELSVGLKTLGQSAKQNKTNPPPEKQFLDDTWGKKEQRIPLLQKLHTNGALGRNAYLRKVPSAVKPGRKQTFRLVVLDPATVYIQTAPGDVDTVLMYCIQYACPDRDPQTGYARQMYYREEISRIDPDGNALQGMPDEDDTWEIRKWHQTGVLNMEPKNEQWILDEVIAWPYNFPPLRHCQNLPLPNDAYGMPDITPGIIGLNNSLNLAKSSANRNLKLLGQPILAASGIGDTDIDLTPGHVNITSPEGKLYSVPITSDMPGALAYIQDLREDVDQESHVPGVASGRMKELPRLQSGVAVELMYQTLIMKNSKKRCTYGELILDTCADLLEMGGFSRDIDVTLQWQSALPKDDLQGVQAAAMKISGVGVSKITIQEEMGYDPDEEAERNAQAAQTQMEMFAKGQGMPPAPQQVLAGQGQQPGQQQPPESPFVSRG